MSPDRRRSSGLFAGLVADPWRKLLAIVLAVLLWFFVDSRIERTTKRTLPLVTEGARVSTGASRDRLAVILPTDRVIGGRFLDGELPLDAVRVIVRGPRYRIEALENERLDLRVTVFQDQDWSTSTVVEFTVADLRRDQRALEGLQIELDPPRIKLELERIDRQEMALSLEVVELIEGPYAGRARRETAEFVPETVTVLGSAKGIDLLRRTPRPFRATLRSSGNSRQATAEIELVDAGALGVRFAAQPLLTMQLLPQTAPFDLDLQVAVDDLALPPEQRGQYEPTERSKRVRLLAGGELRARLVNLREGSDPSRLQDWVAQNLRLVVYIPRPEPGAVYLPEIERAARLHYVGRENVERNECLLDQAVVVKLRRKA
jgi:hypothetical protein